MKTDVKPRIGCAGWSLRTDCQRYFPTGENHLSRYAGRFNAVEINTTFYRPHLPSTYERWRESVPEEFQFSVKMPKQISHLARLSGCEDALTQFLDQAGNLKNKLGCLLLQLPPSFAFDANVAGDFFRQLRDRTDVQTACEPRHASWRTEGALQLLEQFRIAMVSTEPQPPTQAEFTYFRLHGAPLMYKSPYSPTELDQLADTLRERGKKQLPTWCIFDNTASGAATTNALSLQERMAVTP